MMVERVSESLAAAMGQQAIDVDGDHPVIDRLFIDQAGEGDLDRAIFSWDEFKAALELSAVSSFDEDNLGVVPEGVLIDGSFSSEMIGGDGKTIVSETSTGAEQKNRARQVEPDEQTNMDDCNGYANRSHDSLETASHTSSERDCGNRLNGISITDMSTKNDTAVTPCDLVCRDHLDDIANGLPIEDGGDQHDNGYAGQPAFPVGLAVEPQYEKEPPPKRISRAVGGSPPLVHKETKTSLGRKSLVQLSRHRHCLEPTATADSSSSDYLTPSQQKDKVIRNLKRELRELQRLLEAKETEIETILSKKEQEMKAFREEKEAEMKTLIERNDAEMILLLETHEAERIALLEKNDEDVRALTETRDAEAARLSEEIERAVDRERDVTRENEGLHVSLRIQEGRLDDLKEEMVMREERSQEMYLKMYNKGRQSAVFERQESLVEEMETRPQTVTQTELLKKLEATEAQLLQWQSKTRQLSYDEGRKPDTANEAFTFFLRDAIFHYLTDPLEDARYQHLRAVIRLMDFTTPQLDKISRSTGIPLRPDQTGASTPKKKFLRAKSST